MIVAVCGIANATAQMYIGCAVAFALLKPSHELAQRAP